MGSFFLAHVGPLALDFAGHVFVGALFVLWWLSRYAGHLDESQKAENIPLRTDDRWLARKEAQEGGRPPGGTGAKRRLPIALAALIVVGIIGTVLPILTANLALRAPADATPPPGPAQGAEE